MLVALVCSHGKLPVLTTCSRRLRSSLGLSSRLFFAENRTQLLNSLKPYEEVYCSAGVVPLAVDPQRRLNVLLGLQHLGPGDTPIHWSPFQAARDPSDAGDILGTAYRALEQHTNGVLSINDPAVTFPRICTWGAHTWQFGGLMLFSMVFDHIPQEQLAASFAARQPSTSPKLELRWHLIEHVLKALSQVKSRQTLLQKPVHPSFVQAARFEGCAKLYQDLSSLASRPDFSESLLQTSTIAPPSWKRSSSLGPESRVPLDVLNS